MLFYSSKYLETMVSLKMLSSTTFFNIDRRNVAWAANQYIIMISEGSCETENWGNDGKKSALPSQE